MSSKPTTVSLLHHLAPFSLLLLVIFALYAFVYRPIALQDDANAVVEQNAERYVRELFPSFSATTEPWPSSTASTEPALRWRGDTSKIIAVIPDRRSGVLGTSLWWTVYAKTANGRFFSVEYHISTNEGHKVQGAKRMYARSPSQISETAVKNALLNSKMLDVYRTWFGEPPVRKVADA